MMRIMMFSWEYPPKSVGGLAQHVHDLTIALVKQGVEVHLVTCGDPGLPGEEDVQGVHVHRVIPFSLRAPDFRTWVLHLNMAIIEKAISILNKLQEQPPVQLVHNHDWLTAYAARVIKHAYNAPLIATIHATEFGRNYGLHNDEQRYISDVEWWLTYEAWRVIVCSKYMEEEMKRVFQLPRDKMRVLPNGINPSNFRVGEGHGSIKHHYAHPDEKVVYFVGRLVHEKGVQVLLDAIPKVLHYHPKTKFVIAGKGPNSEYLKTKANEMGISQHIYFTGYINDETRNGLYQCADVAVIPSLYEPFGIVALEAMAAKTPVVVSDTGGLSEIIQHQVNGLKVYNGSANSLADNILRLLGEPGFGQQLMSKAYEDVEKIYNWDIIAGKTVEVYGEVLEQYSNLDIQKKYWSTKPIQAANAIGCRMEQQYQ